jgi:hypothetical protein
MNWILLKQVDSWQSLLTVINRFVPSNTEYLGLLTDYEFLKVYSFTQSWPGKREQVPVFAIGMLKS